MEDILDLYHRPLDPARPLVCLDEKSKTLHQQVRPSLPSQPGQVAKQDYEYERNGTINLFMVNAPLLGWRKVTVTAQRCLVDFARQLQQLADVDFPDAERIVLICDNLNTHQLWALYLVYPAAEAKRLLEKFEIHYTPEHGSWLNVAECELSVLSRQCLNRRLADQATVGREVAAWAASQNQRKRKVNWQFSTADARIKLRRLYPTISELS